MHNSAWLILSNKLLTSVDEVTLKCYWILFFQKQPIINEVMNTEWRKRSRSTKQSRGKHSRHSAFNFPFRQSHNQQKECLGFQSMKKRTDAFNIWRSIHWNPRPWIITLSPFSLQFSSLIYPPSPTSWPRSLRNIVPPASSLGISSFI